MIDKLLHKTAVSAAAAIVLTSCGERAAEPVHEATSANTTEASAAVTTEKSEQVTTKDPSDEVFVLDISIDEEKPLPQKYVLDGFEAVMQLPELPTGCEVTALCEDLNYLGFDIDKVTLADEFMPMDNSGIVTMREAYIGDPKSDEGFGCSAPVIVRTADDYFESVGSPCYAADLTGRTLREIFWQVAQGRPVILWSTIDLIITQPNYRWTIYDGEEMWFNDFQHCVVIYGYDYDEGTVSIADPLAGNVKYSMDGFEQAYELMGRQAVMICGDSETRGKLIPRDKPQSPILSRNKAEREMNG